MSGWRSLFPNAWYITVREYRMRIGTRSFVIGTILLAALAFAATQGPVAIDFAMGSSQTKIGVFVTASGLPSDAEVVFDQTLNPPAQTGASGHKSFVISWFGGNDPSDALKKLERGDFSALLIIDRDPSSRDLTFVLRTDMSSDGPQVRSIVSALYALEIGDRLARAGTSSAAIFEMPPVQLMPVSSASGTTTSSISQDISSSLITTGLIVLIFMAIITYGTWVAMGVAEEKGSRVLELMLNAATPLQMLTGKVLGNGAAGVTQYGVVMGAVLAGLVAQGPLRQLVLGAPASGSPFAGLSLAVLAAFIVLFVLGFLLYSLLYAALGSLVSRQEDVQSATSPLMMLIFVGYFLSVFGMQMINEPWIVALSFVPFFSPYLMLARVAVGHVAVWEFALVVVIMLATSAVALFVAARIYSAGVLMYGQRVGFRALFKAARVSR